MINPWRDDIRCSGKLLIAEKAGFRKAPWKGLLRRGVQEFNQLSDQHSLGVTFSIAGAPDEAHVTVDTRAGSGLVGSAPFQSLVPAGRSDSEGRVFRCDISVPADPKVNTPGSYRRVGNGVLLSMLVHEMVHACGLSNAEHSETGDLFMASPSLLPGDTAAQDQVDSSRTDTANNRIGMPPLLLNDETVRKIQQAWQGPSAGLPSSGVSISVAHSASPSRGPVGLFADRNSPSGFRSIRPLSLEPAAGRVIHVWT